jgi:hypothetical protein
MCYELWKISVFARITHITSNKYFRAAYGKKLRPFLSENLTIETLIDFGDAPVFDAIAYASIIIGCKKPPAKSSHKLRAYVWRLEDSLNRTVYRLFALNPEEIALIETSLAT